MTAYAHKGEQLQLMLSEAKQVRVQVKFGPTKNWYKISKGQAQELIKELDIKPESFIWRDGGKPFATLEDHADGPVLYLEDWS